MEQRGSNVTDVTPKQLVMSKNPDIYRILIEQQAILAYIIKDSMKVQDEALNKAALPQSHATNEQDSAQTTKNVPNEEASPPPQPASEQDIPKISRNQHIPQKPGSQEYEEANKKDAKIFSSTIDPLSINANDIRDACSGRLKKLNDKAQSLKDFNQRMADLEFRRQNDRGLGMGM
jgi:hypothetical protein